MAMLSDSVESDRLVLLDKARSAFNSRLDDKARRILQRLAAHANDAGQATTTAAAAGAAVASVPHVGSALPIVAPLAASQPDDPVAEGVGLQLPPMAPSLHSALSSVAPSAAPPVVLPTAHQPPLFLVYHNMGLLNLRAGKTTLSSIFFARAVRHLHTAHAPGSVIARRMRFPAAISSPLLSVCSMCVQLEHAEHLLSSLTPPLPPTISAAPVTPLSPSAHVRMQRQQPSTTDPRSQSTTGGGGARPPPLMTTPSSTSQSLQSPRSPHSAHTASGSPTAAQSGVIRGGLPLYAFLLFKSFDVFYNTGAALLHTHAASAEQQTAGCASLQEWSSSPACTALRLAVRCYQHCLQLPSSPAWELLPPALIASAASKLLRAHLRLADCLILLHRCRREVTLSTAPLHPLLQPDSTVAIESDVGDLALAATHLQYLLAQLRGGGHAPQASALKQAATLQLAHVRLSLADAQGALHLLAPLLLQSPRVTLLAQLYAVESRLLLHQPDAALTLLRHCDSACVRRVLETVGLGSDATPPNTSTQIDSHDLSFALRLYTTLAFLLLSLPRSDDAAQRCIRIGLELQPSHPPLLRLRLLLHLRVNARMPALWMLKRRLPGSAPPLSITTLFT